MRVLVAAGALGGLDAWRAGARIGRAWREAGAEVALVPLAEMGPDWRHAEENLAPGGNTLHVFLDGHDEDSGPVLLSFLGGGVPGTLAGAVHAAPDLGWVRDHLAERPLIGLCRSGEEDAVLTGMNGLTGQHPQWPLARRLVLDRMLADWAGILAAPADGQELAATPGAGAGGGAGAVILALGGRVLTGPQALGELADIERTVAAADLVVTSCGHYDVDAWGGPVVEYVVGLAAAAGRPVVVITGENRTNLAGQRRNGVEAVHAVGDGDITAGCRAFARSWFW